MLQSLTGGDFAAEEGGEPEVDYDSIDQYIEWMKKQREAIREQRGRTRSWTRRWRMLRATRIVNTQVGSSLFSAAKRVDKKP